MFCKGFRRINKKHLVVLSVFCVYFWVSNQRYPDIIKDRKDVLYLAGRQVDSKVGEDSKDSLAGHQADSKAGQDSKVEQKYSVKASQAIESEHQFKDYNTKHVTTLHNLCIETDPSGKKIEIAAKVKVNTKILAVYSSTNDSLKSIKVAHSRFKPHDGRYEIHYHKESRPEHYRYIEDYPAYFTSLSCPSNLHHFWQDSSEGLYRLLKLTNRLGSKVPNQLYYRKPMIPRKYDKDCADIHRYEEILFTFPMRRFHQTYHAEEHGVCYKNAVFGYLPWNDNYNITIEANHHIYKGMNISYPQCGAGNRVTIIQRHNRRILNLDELMEASRSAGYSNTQTVTFEEMKVEDQMRAAYCTDVLVGIQGAGLRWIQYMRPHTAFLEIIWRNWESRYEERFGDYQQIRGTTLYVPDEDAHLNWDDYSVGRNHGKVVPEEEREAMLKRRNETDNNRFWKYADVRIPVDQFTAKLKVLYNYAVDSKKS